VEVMIKISNQQRKIIEEVSVDIAESFFVRVCAGEIDFDSIEMNEQLGVLMAANAVYRAGVPYIADDIYDGFYKSFKNQHPGHKYISEVEPEPVVEGKTVALPVKMLSTEKAYSLKEINQWLNRVKKSADKINIQVDDIVLRVTPKLDGYAAYDDGEVLYTRGDGTRGRDISFVFERGLQVVNAQRRGLGQGEIVISKAYFKENLSVYFENSRNIQASIIAEKNIDERVQKAIDKSAAVFCPFSELANWSGNISDFLMGFDAITKDILNSCQFDVDGVIIEVSNAELKNEMGATRHHHRWQIALKSNDQGVEVVVTAVIAQTSRNGKITPVTEFAPVKLSGAEISRATAHNYGMVRDKGIGKGAIIRLVRSGLVIPKIEEVIESVKADFPVECSSCHARLEWIDDNLFCLNSANCKDQIEKTIIHFFDTLGNNDGFGSATIATLNQHGLSSVYQIYQLENDPDKLFAMGYKEKTVKNLVAALFNSRNVSTEDWRFLAAFGVNRLGLGVAEKLLQHHGIESIFDLSADDFVKIDGFAEITAKQIVAGLANIREQFNYIYKLKFALQVTKINEPINELSLPIAGKIIVFTGAMITGSRVELEKQAKSFGAKVAKSVSTKTDFLVTGEKVGVKKITDAENKGVKVIAEKEYLQMIEADTASV
jgi:DNA ligase (NAD+)